MSLFPLSLRFAIFKLQLVPNALAANVVVFEFGVHWRFSTARYSDGGRCGVNYRRSR